MKFKLFLLMIVAMLLSACSDNVRESKAEEVEITDSSSTTIEEEVEEEVDEGEVKPLKNFSDLVKQLKLKNFSDLEEELNAGSDEEGVSSYELMSSIIAGNFSFDSSFLDELAQETLDKHIEFMKANPEAEAEVQGHCDERGSTSYNIALGERRAKAAYQYMILSGISTDRLSTVSFGSLRPIASCHNESCWSKNRRVQMRYYK